ncbi:MAG: Glu-tRNA(Gln) amidotransferase subunit GatE [Thermofilum sp.]|jgi:glutamyl-tRNA(Gln) amidotransferase subunit E|uniref:Glu-tRNA(Gln) amidotransferase subunit GatE n=1 Tax=Thermofilum sp. TaxID=1961369 RepID=UPI00258D2C9B|nr:Glu-tRNA(Gln) amidotransferase subunit GatE [Thermofilum sp.]MCI4409450.1 Glu-tRNA(Gln) amidotransferase subunit GatE [Thermofilum sp.]
MQGVKIKCGLEIHQMLDTAEKLFCSCPTRLTQDPPHFVFTRRLRLAKSEIGEIDPAALFEYEKGLAYRYECHRDNVCLVEMDEEPPHNMNSEALELALKFSLMIGASIVDEVHVMRKIVIDGSNVSGFQRTSLISLGGSIDVNGKKIRIQTVCLEEDAARKTEEKHEGYVSYRLDRLGIPLIEVSTAPDIESPEEAREVALRIGLLLRALGKVKRGLGTIRQDLNVSVEGGARIEIKGVQYLDLIPKIVELEIQRQLSLLDIRDELKRRNVKEEDLVFEPVDVTDILRSSQSKVVKKALDSGGVALALKLKGFGGLLGREIQPGRRLGTELADRARYWGGVGGLFHSDELPGYGITKDEVEKIKTRLGVEANDAFILIVDSREKVMRALKAAYERAKEALKGVPEETRAANPDGTTKFMRPRPGSARMYPETDIRPIRITPEYLEELRKNLPEPPEKTLERLMKEYSLPKDMAFQLFSQQQIYFFEEAVKTTGLAPQLIATTLTNTIVSLRRDNIPVENLTEEHLLATFKAVADGKIAKEAIPVVLTEFAKNPDASLEEVLKRAGLERLTIEELREIVRKVIQENREDVSQKGEKSFGKLMGIVMERVRGRIDGAVVAQVLREELKKAISS